MFCSKCGAKVEEKDKFCPRCGHAMTDTEPSGAKKKDVASPAAPPASRNWGCLACLDVFLIVLSVLCLSGGSIYYFSDSNQSGNKTELAVGIGLFLFMLFILSVWGLINQSRKNRPIKEPEKTLEETASHNKVRNNYTLINCVTFVTIVVICAVLYFFGKPYIKNTHTDSPTDTTNTGGVTQPPTTQKSYDGYYPTTMTKPNCDSPIELTAFTVTAGAVDNLYGDAAKIGPAGKATMDMGGKMTVNLTFTNNGVSGTWSSSKGCSGTFQGTKM